MAVSTNVRELQAGNRTEELGKACCGPAKAPLHLACGACVSCPDTCDNALCADCDQNLVNNPDLVGSGCGSHSMRYFTWCQVKRHNHLESVWLVAGDDIYDATEYMNLHPGGRNSILKKAGGAADCTEDIQFHSRNGRSVWKKYHLGKVKPCSGINENDSGAKQWWQFWQ